MREMYDLWTVLGNEVWMCWKTKWSGGSRERLQEAKDELLKRGIMEPEIEDFIRRTRKTFLMGLLFFVPFFINAQPKITATAAPKEIIKINILKDTNYVARGWVEPGKPSTRHILHMNISLFNGYPTNFQLADYHKESALFCWITNHAMLKNFFELTLSDSKGYIVRERIGCAHFNWQNPNIPHIPANGMVSSSAGITGAVLDVTGVKDGEYFLTVRLNPSLGGTHVWPKYLFIESGTTVPIKIKNGKAIVYTAPLPKKITYKPAPQWVRNRAATNTTVPALPSILSVVPRPTKK